MAYFSPQQGDQTFPSLQVKLKKSDLGLLADLNLNRKAIVQPCFPDHLPNLIVVTWREVPRRETEELCLK